MSVGVRMNESREAPRQKNKKEQQNEEKTLKYNPLNFKCSSDSLKQKMLIIHLMRPEVANVSGKNLALCNSPTQFDSSMSEF